eukprot:UN2042
MWICYAVRRSFDCAWRWPLAGPVPSVAALFWAGLSRIYLPWVLSYIAFLLSQPLMPDLIAGYETLLGGFIFPGSPSADRLAGKRNGYRAYAVNVVMSVGLPGLLSLFGFAVGALSFQYPAVQVAWIGGVLVGGMVAGFRFYYPSAPPDYKPPGLMYGFWGMGIAWALVLPVYLLGK